MPRVYVSIGSNVERETHIRAAVRAIRERYANPAFSAVYQSKAEGFDGDDFYNLVAAFDTDETIEALRGGLTAIEMSNGRLRDGPRYGPRTLDIDILLYGNLVRHRGKLDVPRREIRDRAYVLGPLAELAPQERHPETGERFVDLWQSFPNRAELREVQLKLD